MNPRIPSKQRRKVALPQLKSKFEATLLDIAAAFKRTEGFQHAQTKGNEREAPIHSDVPKHFCGGFVDAADVVLLVEAREKDTERGRAGTGGSRGTF
jgi:hypothetical protein